MSKVFRTRAEISSALEPLCNKAVENACNRLLGTLQELIDTEYYDQYEPERYKRTYSFWRSAMTKMLSNNCGQIFMNEDTMDYGQFWSGELQLEYASQGYHGTEYIQTKGRFWDSFIEFCEKNAVKILCEELQKQGISIKK